MAVYVFCWMPRVNRIMIFLTYHVYLYSINCPTVICLPSMCYLSYGEKPLVNCGPWSYFHHIAITYLLYSHCLLYSHIIITFHPIRSYPLFQANQWDWQPHRKLGTKYLAVCVQVPYCYWSKTSKILLLYSSYLPLGIPNWTVKRYHHRTASSPDAVMPLCFFRTAPSILETQLLDVKDL
jgi:hypothetical protein